MSFFSPFLLLFHRLSFCSLSPPAFQGEIGASNLSTKKGGSELLFHRLSFPSTLSSAFVLLALEKSHLSAGGANPRLGNKEPAYNLVGFRRHISWQREIMQGCAPLFHESH